MYQEGHGLPLESPPPFSNAVYSYHLYRLDWQPDGYQATAPFEKRAQKWNVPVWLGEFNAFGAGAHDRTAPTDWKQQLQEMLQYLSDYNTGWLFWEYTGPSSLVNNRGKPRRQLLQTLQDGF